MEIPKITVYVVSHNYGRFLQQALDSVLRQSFDSFELLIFDDGSSDNTEDIMNRYEGHSKIKTFHTDGIGLPAVCNLAIENARGEYLIRLDADDYFDDNILLVLSHWLDRNSDAVMVFPDYYLVDESGGTIRIERREQMYRNNHMLDVPAHGACTMIRTEALRKIGGYRTDLGAQDGFDIWTRLIKDHKCGNVNLPLFYYRRHGKNLTDTPMRIIDARREIKRDAIKNYLKEYTPITAVILCRKNFDYIQDIWSQKINGKNLLQLAIERSLAVDIFDHVVVASDTPEVKKVMAQYDDPRLVYFERKEIETIPSANIVTSLELIAREIQNNQLDKGMFVLSYLGAPFTSSSSLEEAIYTLMLSDADSAFSVREIDKPVYRRAGNGLIPLQNNAHLRSDHDVCFYDDNTVLATLTRNFHTGSRLGAKVVNFTIPQNESYFIDGALDLEIAKVIYQELKKTQKKK